MTWKIVSYQDEQGRQPVNDFVADLPQKTRKTPRKELAIAERRLTDVLTRFEEE